jgi:hypothetical protein
MDESCTIFRGGASCQLILHKKHFELASKLVVQPRPFCQQERCVTATDDRQSRSLRTFFHGQTRCCHKILLPIQVQQTPSICHPLAQRSADRRRDVHQQ